MKKPNIENMYAQSSPLSDGNLILLYNLDFIIHNNNNNNFILTPDSEVKLRSVVFTITITISKTSRVKNCQYIHKLPIQF